MASTSVRNIISNSRVNLNDTGKIKGQNTVHTGKGEKVRGQKTSNGKSSR